MNEKDIKKLQEMAKFFRSTSGKIKIISLLNRAKEEYNQKIYISSDSNIRKTKAQKSYIFFFL